MVYYGRFDAAWVESLELPRLRGMYSILADTKKKEHDAQKQAAKVNKGGHPRR